jgi:hypothetical protein
MLDPGPTPPRPAPEPDPRIARTPTIRSAWAIIIKDPAMKAGQITIFENKSGGRVTIEEAHSGVERSIDLNVLELRALAELAARIARRVASRPEGQP